MCLQPGIVRFMKIMIGLEQKWQQQVVTNRAVHGQGCLREVEDGAAQVGCVDVLQGYLIETDMSPDRFFEPYEQSQEGGFPGSGGPFYMIKGAGCQPQGKILKYNLVSGVGEGDIIQINDMLRGFVHICSYTWERHSRIFNKACYDFIVLRSSPLSREKKIPTTHRPTKMKKDRFTHLMNWG